MGGIDMFLDEELKQILFAKELKTKEDVTELSKNLLQCMINRVPNPSEVSTQDFLTEIKKIDNGWRLFCKSHPTLSFKEDFWRNFILRKDEDDKFKKALDW